MVLNRENIEVPQDVLGAVQFFLDRYPEHTLHRGEGVIALNEPPGVAMSNGGVFFTESLLQIAERIEGRPLKPVNRLDRDTSGVVFLAEHRAAARALAMQFQNREVTKTYLALVRGSFPESISGILAPLKSVKEKDRTHVEVSLEESSKFARTGFGVLAVMLDQDSRVSTLIEVRLYTGRTHQIRVHCAELGFPILGDSVYGSERAFSRQMLHSHTTRLVLPGSKTPSTVSAPMPIDFRGYMERHKIIKGEENIDRLMA